VVDCLLDAAGDAAMRPRGSSHPVPTGDRFISWPAADMHMGEGAMTRRCSTEQQDMDADCWWLLLSGSCWVNGACLDDLKVIADPRSISGESQWFLEKVQP